MIDYIPVNIDEETGNADEYVCTDGGFLDDNTLIMFGWDELDMIESYFINPVWMKVVVND